MIIPDLARRALTLIEQTEGKEDQPSAKERDRLHATIEKCMNETPYGKAVLQAWGENPKDDSKTNIVHAVLVEALESDEQTASELGALVVDLESTPDNEEKVTATNTNVISSQLSKTVIASGNVDQSRRYYRSSAGIAGAALIAIIAAIFGVNQFAGETPTGEAEQVATPREQRKSQAPTLSSAPQEPVPQSTREDLSRLGRASGRSGAIEVVRRYLRARSEGDAYTVCELFTPGKAGIRTGPVGCESIESERLRKMDAGYRQAIRKSHLKYTTTNVIYYGKREDFVWYIATNKQGYEATLTIKRTAGRWLIDDIDPE